jgi:hypothetical protein
MRTETLFGLLLVAAACTTQSPPPAPLADAAPSSTGSIAGEIPMSVPPVVVDRNATLETDGRDPFQPGPLSVIAPPPTKCHDCDFEDFAVDQLKLVGIVTGDETRAMLVDPNGRGRIVTRGSGIGRTELRDGVPISWRVDRIVRGKLVLVREDPLRQDRAPETRVIALYADS